MNFRESDTVDVLRHFDEEDISRHVCRAAAGIPAEEREVYVCLNRFCRGQDRAIGQLGFISTIVTTSECVWGHTAAGILSKISMIFKKA